MRYLPCSTPQNTSWHLEIVQGLADGVLKPLIEVIHKRTSLAHVMLMQDLAQNYFCFLVRRLILQLYKLVVLCIVSSNQVAKGVRFQVVIRHFIILCEDSLFFRGQNTTFP